MIQTDVYATVFQAFVADQKSFTIHHSPCIGCGECEVSIRRYSQNPRCAACVPAAATATWDRRVRSLFSYLRVDIDAYSAVGRDDAIAAAEAGQDVVVLVMEDWTAPRGSGTDISAARLAGGRVVARSPGFPGAVIDAGFGHGSRTRGYLVAHGGC